MVKLMVFSEHIGILFSSCFRGHGLSVLWCPCMSSTVSVCMVARRVGSMFSVSSEKAIFEYFGGGG